VRTIPEMIGIVCREHAGRPAIFDGAVCVTYADLERRISFEAAHLESLGTAPGDRVALMLPNGVDFVAMYLAAISVGAIAVPVNPSYQRMELLPILATCAVSLLITSKALATRCGEVIASAGLSCRLLLVEDPRPPRASEVPLLARPGLPVDPHCPVMYQFSSGSTGQPKRIARTHANLVFELDSLVSALGLTSADRVLGVTPFSHVNGLMRSMLASIRAGAMLFPLPQFDRRTVTEVIAKERISVFIGVPFMFTMLARAYFDVPPDFSSLRLCFSSSAPLPRRTSLEFGERWGQPVRQLYRSTETGTISADVALRPMVESVGTPIPGVEVAVLGGDGRVAGTDAVGEVAVKSPAAITSYGGSEGSDAFRDGFFYTSDLGWRDAAGRLYLVGRKTVFINKGGYKINPREIEALIEDHPSVSEAAAVAVPTASGDETVRAIVTLNAPVTEEEIVEFCRGKIADFKIPGIIEFRDQLPKGPTGKVSRSLLG
jgi:long-chain acyl-CoA synthetase